ncbi:MAG TPA: FAD/NAD(P)-binding protein, partial [Pseudoxanthomonas sp.]|nr:FAD/NAD(P)-binding protein [Pseudoxanthomonas sp.]
VEFLVAAEPEAARETLAAGYAQRRHYGEYLRQRLWQAREASATTLVVLRDRVEALTREYGGLRLDLASGSTLRPHGVVLALGNSPRPLPARGAAGLPEWARPEAWDFEAIRRIPTDAEVCIAGSGLSMVDTVLSLAGNGHAGPIHVLSRHALLPLPHAAHAACDLDTQPLLAMDLRQRMRWLREAARDAERLGLPWQALMERVRPQVQALWRSLSYADQRRFLRHAVRYWDVHRHRIAPQVHAQLERLRRSGQLRLHRGRLQTAAPQGSRIRLSVRMRDRHQPLDVDRVVNATGVELRAALMRSPLLSQLLGSGLAQPGPHGIGVDSDPDGWLVDAQGRTLPQVQVVGSLRIGNLWESIAVSELRGQAQTAIDRLLSPAKR